MDTNCEGPKAWASPNLQYAILVPSLFMHLAIYFTIILVNKNKISFKRFFLLEMILFVKMRCIILGKQITLY